MKQLRNKTVFIIPLVVIILSTLIYVFFALNFDHSDASTTRFTNILEQYENIPEQGIIFIGDSQIREDINCNTIAENCFNFGVAGLLPLQLALHKDKVIQSNPETVVIGISPLFFNEQINKNDDFYIALGQHRTTTDNFLLKRLTKDEQELLTMNRWDQLLHKRKFILPFYIGIIKNLFSDSKPSIITNNFKNSSQFTIPQKTEQLQQKLQDPKTLPLFNITQSSKRQRESLIYIIKELEAANIKIVMLNMPLNPFLTDQLNNQSIQEYSTYLKALSSSPNIILITPKNFSKEEFIDLTHLNNKGREHLSKQLRGDLNII